MACPPEDAVRTPAPQRGAVAVRLWAGAAAAAGARSSRAELSLELAGDASVAWVRDEVVRRHPDRPQLPTVLDCCSVLVDDRPLGRRDRASVVVRPGQSVEFLPPFAGG